MTNTKTTGCADLQRPGEEEEAARPAVKAGIKYITPDNPALQGQGHHPDLHTNRCTQIHTKVH